MSRRVIVLSWHSPSSDAMGAQRVRSFIEFLPKLGWHVDLITTQPWVPQIEGVAVHVVRDPITDWRQKAGVTTLTGWRRVLSGVAWRGFVPDEQVLWSLRAARLGAALQPAVVLTSGPPFSQWRGAERIANAHGTALVYDYRDLWTQSPYMRPGRLRRQIQGLLERRAWRRMSVATTVSEPLARELRAGSGRRTHVVMNGYESSRVDTSPSALPGPLKLLHTGQLYEGRRDPGPLLQAARLSGLTPDELQIEFVGPDQDSVAREAKRLGIEALVHVREQVTRQQALDLQSTADILVLLLWNDPKEEGVYSGKLFDYIASRRPILMLGYEAGVAAQLIKVRELGCIANNPETLSRMLVEWHALKRAGELNLLPTDRILGLSREDQAGILSDVLQDLL